ncbi:MAG: HypC/HybG/HupF family hydrogenase formation chaperone, partial [Candidatus Woesearchaeota archaeon]
MCYAIPAKILEIKGDEAKVDYGGVFKKINISLMPDVKINDYVLVHAGFAIEKVSELSAKETLKILEQIEKDNNIKKNIKKQQLKSNNNDADLTGDVP